MALPPSGGASTALASWVPSAAGHLVNGGPLTDRCNCFRVAAGKLEGQTHKLYDFFAAYPPNAQKQRLHNSSIVPPLTAGRVRLNRQTDPSRDVKEFRHGSNHQYQHQLADRPAQPGHQPGVAEYGHPAPIVRPAHQQRQGRCRRLGDFGALHQPDPRPEPSFSVCGNWRCSRPTPPTALAIARPCNRKSANWWQNLTGFRKPPSSTARNCWTAPLGRSSSKWAPTPTRPLWRPRPTCAPMYTATTRTLPPTARALARKPLSAARRQSSTA